MLILSKEEIENVATPETWVDCMELAIKSANDKEYNTPNRLHVNIGKNTLLIMPSAGPSYYATKIVSVFPENVKKGKPVINGDVILNDSSTGETLALINGAKLTALRTAAVATVGLRYLKQTDNNSIGIIGAGEQGKHIARFACSELKLKTINVYDRSEEAIAEFKTYLWQRCKGLQIIICAGTSELVKNSKIIITATTSSVPVITDDPELVKSKTFIGVGSFKPDMREFPDSVYSTVENIWVDADHGIKESGDLIYPVQNKLIEPNKVRNVRELIIKSIPISNNGASLYKTVGLAVFDLFAATLLYEEAQKKNIGNKMKI